MNILEFRRDPNLLGSLPHHRDPETQRAWDTFLAVVYGLPIDETGLELFRACTGRTEPRVGGYPESVLITGRQSGKSQTAADIVVYEAATATKEEADGTYALLVAQDHRGAQRTLFRYVLHAFESSPILRPCIVGQTADTITLNNGVVVAVYPCRPSAVRGIRSRVSVIDELAFFRASDGNPVDVEMRRSEAPTRATTGGRGITLSSPYGQTGALWELHRRHFARDDSSTLVWVAPAPPMNPTLASDYLQRLEQDDPEGYRSEVLGEFRAGQMMLLDPAALDQCIADWRELPPARDTRYFGFYDASGGRRDAAVAAIGHRDAKAEVVDVVRAWNAPHNPADVIGEAAALFKSYGVREIEADRYGGAFPVDAFRSHGVRVYVAELDRSRLYLELLPKVNAASVLIPNDPVLLRELRGLERRTGPSGRDRVDHRQGSHDDRANALAGVVNMMAGANRDGAGARPLAI